MNNLRRRAHEDKAAALGHPAGLGKVICHTCLVKPLQTPSTLLFPQESQNEEEEPDLPFPLSQET